MPRANEHTVYVPINAGKLEGDLEIPPTAQGLVLFAHGSGSSRFSPRNRFVAEYLRSGNIATLLIDLLTAEEELMDQDRGEFRFNIKLLTDRLVHITEWLARDERTRHLKLGYFGASTGAAAALCAAARVKGIGAVVSRGGRPDLAEKALPQVKAPTLLIVGGHDFPVIEMNQEALEQLLCEKQMVIVPHATHLFEEKGALEKVAELALEWFQRYLR